MAVLKDVAIPIRIGAAVLVAALALDDQARGSTVRRRAVLDQGVVVAVARAGRERGLDDESVHPHILLGAEIDWAITIC